MNNVVYVVRDMDMNYTVGVYKTLERALKVAADTMFEAGYTSFNFLNMVNTYLVTFPHGDPKCEGHWRIEKYEVEG